MNYDKIGEFIKTKRKEKNLTQKELAERINVTDKAISKWERGSGCPDVSLLEALSKELDVSILELLKGREIENEVINVVEADDYIKDTLGYMENNNKEKIKNIFNHIIQFLIIFIVCLLAYLNIVQYRYMDKKYTYRINRDVFEKVTDTINNIDENIKTIENNKGNYNNEDHATIVKGLKEDYTKINNIYYIKMIKELKPIEYRLEDLRLFTDFFYYPINSNDIIKLLRNYTNSNMMTVYFSMAIMNRPAHEPEGLHGLVLDSYYYQISYKNKSIMKTNPWELNELDNKAIYTLKEFLYLTEIIKEVGGINE